MNKLIEALKFASARTMDEAVRKVCDEALSSINITPTEARAALYWLQHTTTDTHCRPEVYDRHRKTIISALSAFAGVE